MKLSRIKTACVATGEFRLFNETDEDGMLTGQWIANGIACWKLTGKPTIGTENIPAVFGLSAKQVEKARISVQDFPEIYNSSDYDTEDQTLTVMNTSLRNNGKEYLVLMDQRKGEVYLADVALLAPVWTEDTQILLRHDTGENKRPYFAVMDGFFVSGIVMPLSGNILSKNDKEAMKVLIR